jgi:hypothetical protein
MEPSIYGESEFSVIVQTWDLLVSSSLSFPVSNVCYSPTKSAKEYNFKIKFSMFICCDNIGAGQDRPIVAGSFPHLSNGDSLVTIIAYPPTTCLRF